jgi:replicative DNA helicase
MSEGFYSENAEEAVLGCLMKSSENWDPILALISPAHMHKPNNTIIMSCIQNCIEQHSAVDLVLIRDELSKISKLETVGGSKRLAELLHGIPTDSTPEAYAKIVLECWRRRKLKSIAGELSANCSSTMTTEDLVLSAEQQIHETTKMRHERELVSVADFVESIDFDPGSFISTGYNGIDNLIYGLGEADMIVMAGRPGSGKSALAVNIASNVASKGTPVGMFSLEMTNKQLQQRLICAKARVNLKDALQGRLTLKHEQDIARAKGWLKEYPLYIDDNPILTPEILRRKVMRMVNRLGVQTVVIDYLQLMRSAQFPSLHEKVTHISQSLKAIALEFGIPIIVLAQLNRKPEDREDGQPKVSDLRDSGSIEQDADIVILIHRLDLYSEANTGESHIIVGKNRRGETGIVPVTYIGNYTLFMEQ